MRAEIMPSVYLLLAESLGSNYEKNNTRDAGFILVEATIVV